MQQLEHADSISLNKYISQTGICSRREADRFIKEGRVTINGQPTRPGNRVSPGDIVKLDGRPVKKDVAPIYIALNKPEGITCTTDTSVPDNIISYLSYPERLFPIGRLDKPSEGLIFLTNDGDIVNKILRAGNAHEKVYSVWVDKAITEEFINSMASGVNILGTRTKKCKVIKINDKTFEITLIQGLNRQIRRMCEVLGYEVTRLKRTKIMNITLKGLNTGQWRELSDKELQQIFELVKTSTKTAPKSKTNKNSEKTPTAKRTFRNKKSGQSSSHKKKRPGSREERSFKSKRSGSSKAKSNSGKRIGKSKPGKRR